MTLLIADDAMSSDRGPHTARAVPGTGQLWEVSWLPGRHLTRNEAITAMVIADAGEALSGQRAWVHVEGWAAELGMSARQALAKVATAPAWAKTTQHLGDLADPEAAG